jgi:F-type H+-transporting ATPase subunit b
MNEQIFILLAEETQKGVLFDIGATLPLVAIQFLMLMFILNILLYNPLLTLINERNEYVLDNLNKASEMTLAAKELNVKYESELIITKKEAKLEITELQKIQQEKFNNELKVSQKHIETLIQTVLESFNTKKVITLNNLENEIKILSSQMLNKLLIK